jgi:hypothetical protein
MTTPGSSTARTATSRRLQEDLLQDLLQTAPIPATRPESDHLPASRPGRTGAGRGATPTVELRVTPRSWAPPSLRSVPGRPGVVLSAGPIRVSISHY